MRKSLIGTGLIVVTALAGSATTALAAESFEGQVKDAWLTGRIESVYLLNEHLSPFAISTSVEDGVVHLSGIVDSDIDRDLAGALAKNLDGVVKVENNLTVEAGATNRSADDGTTNHQGRRDFGSWVDDATTTAAVKTRLIANANTKGLQIDVDTMNDVATLSGRVNTAEEKALAEEIARHTKDVVEVHNNLVVDPE